MNHQTKRDLLRVVDGLTEGGKETLTTTTVQHAEGIEVELAIASADSSTKALANQGLPVYVPPRRGAPKTRVGGAPDPAATLVSRHRARRSTAVS